MRRPERHLLMPLREHHPVGRGAREIARHQRREAIPDLLAVRGVEHVAQLGPAALIDLRRVRRDLETDARKCRSRSGR